MIVDVRVSVMLYVTIDVFNFFSSFKQWVCMLLMSGGGGRGGKRGNRIGEREREREHEQARPLTLEPHTTERVWNLDDNLFGISIQGFRTGVLIDDNLCQFKASVENSSLELLSRSD